MVSDSCPEAEAVAVYAVVAVCNHTPLPTNRAVVLTQDTQHLARSYFQHLSALLSPEAYVTRRIFSAQLLPWLQVSVACLAEWCGWAVAGWAGGYSVRDSLKTGRCLSLDAP